MGGLRLFDTLCDSLHRDWLVKNEHKILMNVFSILKFTDTASTINTLLDCLSMLRKLLSLCHGSSKHIDTMPVDSLEEVDDVLLDILISSTSHDAYLIRDISKIYLEEMSKLRGVTVANIFSKRNEYINNLINFECMSEDTLHLKFGMLSFVSYLLESKSNVVPINDNLLYTLMNII